MLSWLSRAVEAVIEATDEEAIARSDVYDRPPVTCWSKGRVTLLGEAAHAMMPNTAQEACPVIEDADVLIECLKATRDVSDVLRAYETRRIGHTTTLANRSAMIGASSLWDRPLDCSLRDQVMRLAFNTIVQRQYVRDMTYEG